MTKYTYILLCFFFGCSQVLAQIQLPAEQVSENLRAFEIKGVVQGKDNYEPISGVEVSTDRGAYIITNLQGEYKIKAYVGDELTFRSAEFETKRHIVSSAEDVDVVVEGYSKDGANRNSSKMLGDDSASNHQSYLDSIFAFV